MPDDPGRIQFRQLPPTVAMLIRLITLGLVGVALLGACDRGSPEADVSRLVIIDGDGNVVTLDSDGSDRVVVGAAGESRGFFQPVWSPDGLTVAWGQFHEDGFALVASDSDGEEPIEIETSGLPFYLSWSPDSALVGLLHAGSPGEIDFVIADVGAGESLVVDAGTSYYFSWESDSSGVVAHIGTSDFDRIGIDGSSQSLGSTDTEYLAPFVTDAGLLHVSEGNLILDGDPVVGVPGSALFVPNREGTRVAVVSPGVGVTVANERSLSPGQLVVIEVESGDLHEVTATPIAGFFWNPDGDRLLVLTADRSGQITPLVWEADGELTEFGAYRPAEAYVQDVLPFFPQYAQSVSFWNREGTAFAFVGTVEDVNGVWIQDLSADEPIHLSEGSWVAWSP